jgi:hypothetical protein
LNYVLRLSAFPQKQTNKGKKQITGAKAKTVELKTAALSEQKEKTE